MTEPTTDELRKLLEAHVGADGSTFAAAIQVIVRETGWSGRLVDVLRLLAADTERMGYLAGGRRPDEVLTWLSIWADTTLSLEEMELIISAGGWDPEPFVALARAGLLEAFLRAPDGTIRRINGEPAGGWASDELALANDEEVLAAAIQIIHDHAS